MSQLPHGPSRERARALSRVICILIAHEEKLRRKVRPGRIRRGSCTSLPQPHPPPRLPAPPCELTTALPFYRSNFVGRVLWGHATRLSFTLSAPNATAVCSVRLAARKSRLILAASVVNTGPAHFRAFFAHFSPARTSGRCDACYANGISASALGAAVGVGAPNGAAVINGDGNGDGRDGWPRGSGGTKGARANTSIQPMSRAKWASAALLGRAAH